MVRGVAQMAMSLFWPQARVVLGPSQKYDRVLSDPGEEDDFANVGREALIDAWLYRG